MTDVLENALFSRRAVTLGMGAAMALAARPVRAAGSLNGFHDVRTYGAKGDGIAIDSPAFNRAIQAASAKGGGTVVVPPGRYLCFSIRLESHITLLLSAGSTIIAADPRKHQGRYDLPEGVFEEQYVDYGLAHFHNSLIYGDGVSDVAIIGPGLIHGEGLEREAPAPRWHGIAGWKSPKELGLSADAARRADPREMAYEGLGIKAIGLTKCRNVLLKDFTILKGGHFACYVLGSSNVAIDGLVIDTDRDGIDIDCCRGVRITNCTVNSPKDDGIVMKSSLALQRPVMCEDVSVIGCHTSGWTLGTLLDGTRKPTDYSRGPFGRIKLGTDSVAGFRNMLIADCQCDTTRGLQMGAIDGGVLEDVSFRDITLINPVNHPIFVRLSARNRAPLGTGVATVRRVHFSNIAVSGAPMQYPSGVVGIVDGIIDDVSFNGIHVTAVGGGTAEDAARQVPERRESSLEPNFMKTLPAYGFYSRHARNLRLTDVHFAVATPDARPAVALEDVRGAVIAGLTSSSAPASAVRATGSSAIATGDVRQLQS